MKWYGQIGYRDSVEVEPGVWEDEIIEVNRYGDILKNYKSDQQGSKINSDVAVSNQISILADPNLMESFHKILYVTFMGAKWKVSSVDVQYPRLIVSLGALYVEEEEEEDDED